MLQIFPTQGDHETGELGDVFTLPRSAPIMNE
jgi:hypothetical protein